MTFKASLSGLNAAQADLDVISNNIANSETTGFKSSRTEFSDVYASAFSSIANTSPGAGVTVGQVSQQFDQGNLQFTSRDMDLAIEGQGFFVLRNTAGSLQYSRAGVMGVDRDGYIVTEDQSRLQAYPPAANGTFSTGNMGDLRIQSAVGSPQATTQVNVGLNLDATEVYPGSPGVPLVFDPNLPNTYNRSSSIIGFDSLGVQHNINSYFVKDSVVSNRWFMYSYIDGTNPADELTVGGVSPVQLDFDSGGLLTTVMPVAYDPTTTINAATGANEMVLTMDLTGSSQYGSPFALNAMSQDGFGTGNFSGVAIEDSGIVSAQYTNGQFTIIGKIALATFANPQGLAQLGSSSWGDTQAAGDVTFGEALTGEFGAIHSGALEASNVDIAAELVKLIIAQRNYQANAQAISTEDQMTQTIINIR